MGGQKVKCHRCGSVMVCERFYGHDDRFWGWRCISCGEIVDDVILENRQWSRKGVLSVDKKTTYGGSNE